MEIYKISKDEIKEMAMNNFRNNEVNIQGRSNPKTNDKLIQISGKKGLVGGILFDIEFISSICKKVGKQISIGIINSDILLLTTNESSFEQKFEDIANSINSENIINLNPAIYEWKDGNMIFKRNLKK